MLHVFSHPPVSLSVAARCMLCSFFLPCSSSPIHIDARVLCQAAGSLRTLNLIVRWSCTLEALAEVFDHRPLEELDLFLNIAGEVRSECYKYVVWTLKDQIKLIHCVAFLLYFCCYCLHLSCLSTYHMHFKFHGVCISQISMCADFAISIHRCWTQWCLNIHR